MSCLRIIIAAYFLGLFLVSSAAYADSVPEEVASAAHALDAATSFRLISVKGKGRTVVEVQRPDRVRLLLDGGWEIIRIGQNVWGRRDNGPWRQLSDRGPGRIAELANIALPQHPTIQRLADESDGTALAHVYAVGGDPSVPVLRWFIRRSDGRLHRIAGPTPDGGSMTIQIEDYDAPVVIEPPQPSAAP